MNPSPYRLNVVRPIEFCVRSSGSGRLVPPIRVQEVLVWMERLCLELILRCLGHQKIEAFLKSSLTSVRKGLHHLLSGFMDASYSFADRRRCFLHYWLCCFLALLKGGVLKRVHAMLDPGPTHVKSACADEAGSALAGS